MSDYADLYMEAFVATIDEMAKANGYKKGEFATKVWPDMSSLWAVKRWQAMRTKSHITGRPQGVLVSDALRMAEILGVDLPYVFLKARVTADEKFAALNREAPKTKASGKKQPEKNSKNGKA